MKTSQQIHHDSFEAPKIRFSNKEHIFVFCFTVVSLFVHSQFVLDGFGEIDAANFAVTSLEWNEIGKPIFVSTLFRTSIFYLQYLKSAIALGFPVRNLDILMNMTNVIFGSLSCIPLYYFWRRFKAPGAAIVYLVILFFAPAFWLGNIYGFPHIIALFFFFLSILFFDFFLTKTSKIQLFYLGVSFLCAVITVGFKSDIILCFGAFAGLVYYRKPWSLLSLISAVIIPIGAFIIIVTYSRLLFPELSNSTQFAREWFRYFPFTFHAFTDSKNLAASITPVGIILSIASFSAVIYGVLQKKHINLLLFILSWSLPIGFFWSARMGNSARHMLSAWTPLLFYTALIIEDVIPRTRYQVLFLIILLSTNYFICPTNQLSRTVRPSSRIFHAKPYLQDHVSQWHRLGERFASVRQSKKMIVGSDLIRYVSWEVLKTEPCFSYDFTEHIYRLSDHCNKQQYFKQLHVPEENLITIKAAYPDWKISYLKIENNNQTFNLMDIGCSE